jgi:hypothetical protein
MDDLVIGMLAWLLGSVVIYWLMMIIAALILCVREWRARFVILKGYRLMQTYLKRERQHT